MTDSHDGDFVQSLERGLSVIRAFDAEHPKLTLSEVAASTGLSRAAARRFLRTLVQLGYMRSDGSRFALRPKILELGYAYLSSLTLPEVAMPHLEQLVEQVHESSSVSELDGDDVVYIARVPTKRIMTVTISVGTRFPAYATSMGRVLLAAQPDDWLDGYLASASLRGLTGHTITSAPALRRELRKIRAQGWALVDQELEEGLRSIAAPVRDADGQAIAAVNVSTHAGRRTIDSIMDELLQPLLATARRIELDLARSRASVRARPQRVKALPCPGHRRDNVVIARPGTRPCVPAPRTEGHRCHDVARVGATSSQRCPTAPPHRLAAAGPPQPGRRDLRLTGPSLLSGPAGPAAHRSRFSVVVTTPRDFAVADD